MLWKVMRLVHAGVYARRVKTLANIITPLLRPGDRVLDVGAGGGGLGRQILSTPSCPENLIYEGLECKPRAGAMIPMHEYDGGVIPFPDGAYDIVVVADVLHHEKSPERLFRECLRVSRRAVLVKDHRQENAGDWLLVSLLDWAANGPYGVPCLFRYYSLREWREFFAKCGGRIEQEITAIALYPRGWNLIFGGRLHYFASVQKDDGDSSPTN